MTFWIVFAAALFATVALAQTTDSPARPGASSLALPRPGVALSLEQTEERSRKTKGGASVETIHSKIYRDPIGKLRIESQTAVSSGGSSSSRTILVDPVAGATVVFADDIKTAYRMFGPKGDALLGVGLIAPQQLPVKWTLATQSTGKRDISGFTFEGTRIVQSA